LTEICPFFFLKIATHVIGMNPSSVSELLQQQYLFDPNIKIAQLLDNESKKLGTELRIVEIIRFACGENVVREQANFANEVSQMLRK
jgi:translation elongation factor EF-Ts